jgi:hypothetical protein
MPVLIGATRLLYIVMRIGGLAPVHPHSRLLDRIIPEGRLVAHPIEYRMRRRDEPFMTRQTIAWRAGNGSVRGGVTAPGMHVWFGLGDEVGFYK